MKITIMQSLKHLSYIRKNNNKKTRVKFSPQMTGQVTPGDTLITYTQFSKQVFIKTNKKSRKKGSLSLKKQQKTTALSFHHKRLDKLHLDRHFYHIYTIFHTKRSPKKCSFSQKKRKKEKISHHEYHCNRPTATHLLWVCGSRACELGVIASIDLQVHWGLLYQRLASNQQDAALARLIEQVLCLAAICAGI